MTPTVVLDSQPPNRAWLLSADDQGRIVITAVTYLPIYPTSVTLVSSGGFAWKVTIQNGLLQTTAGTAPAQLPALPTPQLMLRWSDDGGKTWSNEYWQEVGAVGQYKKRVIWRRLGRSRDRVYELLATDPIPWRIIDAYLDADPGFKPQERMTSQLRKGA